MSTQTLQRSDPTDFFPQEEEFKKLLDKRSRRARIWQAGLLGLLMIAVLALGTLLYTVINDAFGLVAVVNGQDPQDVVASLGYDPVTVAMGDLEKDELVTLLSGAVSRGVGRRLEREQRFYSDRLIFETEDVWSELCASAEATPGCTKEPRDASDVLGLVEERVIVPDVIVSNKLIPSLFDASGFENEVQRLFVEAPQRFGDYSIDDVQYEWRAWLNVDFITSPLNSTPEIAGVRTAILGTLWLVAITLLFAVPVGVGAAIYLEEFARPGKFNEFIQTNINNLAGVPSIIYGMLGLAVLVRTFEPLTSGALFTSGPPPSENGRTLLSAGITLGLLILPVIIISAQEALRSVPGSLRMAGMCLGATKWQTVRSQVLPVALPGILTGVILAVARAIGETAPLIVVGASGFITADPTGPFSRFTAMPIQIFQWTSFPQEEFRNLAAAGILVLLIMLLTLNGVAVVLRNKYSRRA